METVTVPRGRRQLAMAEMLKAGAKVADVAAAFGAKVHNVHQATAYASWVGKKCRHCGGRAVTRPRGLCFRCHSSPAIRCLYPKANSPVNRRGEPDFNGTAPLPEPTDAEPGSPGKLLAMRFRAGRRLALFHPQDAGAVNVVVRFLDLVAGRAAGDGDDEE